MSERGGPLPRQLLDDAAKALNNLLNAGGYNYRFFGGYEIILLGDASRTTKDIDVQVKVSKKKGEHDLREVLKANGYFVPLGDPNRPDHSIRAIWYPKDAEEAKGVGIDILLDNGGFVDLPKNAKELNIDETTSIPCFPVTHLLRVKLACHSKRSKEVDTRDLKYLWNTFYDEIDFKKIRKNTLAGVPSRQALDLIREKVREQAMGEDMETIVDQIIEKTK